MTDWGTFLTGGAAGGLTGILAGSLVGNVVQQLLQEWRDTRSNRREQERERRADARALRDAKRAVVLPALDTLFDAATTVMLETGELSSVVLRGARDTSLFGSENLVSSPALDAAVRQIAHALPLVERETDAHQLVNWASSLRMLYDDLIRDGAPNNRTQRRQIVAMLDEMGTCAWELQQAVVECKAGLDEPL